MSPVPTTQPPPCAGDVPEQPLKGQQHAGPCDTNSRVMEWGQIHGWVNEAERERPAGSEATQAEAGR